MFNPVQILESAAADSSLSKSARASIVSLLDRINKDADRIDSLTRLGVDCDQQYERLYNLEREAWRMIERLDTAK